MRPDPHPTTPTRALVVDAGTTCTKVALGRGHRLTRLGEFPSGDDPEGWRARLDDLLARAGLALDRRHVDLVAVSSVTAAATGALRALADHLHPRVPVRFVTVASAPLDVDYEPPESLGPDRVAGAVGALAGWGAPVVVVDVGTAITCDVVAPGGRFVGGAIAPGPWTGYRGLVERSPQLAALGDLVTAVAADGPSAPPAGTSTAASLRAGVLRGAAALVDGLVRAQQRLVGPCPVVATGGLGPVVAALSDTITAVDPDLTLRGTLVACDGRHPRHRALRR